MSERAVGYWQEQYRDEWEHHALQNEQLARDFCVRAKARPAFQRELEGRTGVEIGCGTGDLCAKLININYCHMEGTDLSANALDIARTRFPHISFRQHDILHDTPYAGFDLAVASNVLEHFRDPHPVIGHMFKFAPTLLVIGPWGQDVRDGYEAEGGAGHVSELNLLTFTPYTVKAFMLFKSDGWSCEDSEYQFAAVLRR